MGGRGDSARYLKREKPAIDNYDERARKNSDRYLKPDVEGRRILLNLGTWVIVGKYP